jgi:hypothetical protein
MNTTAQVERGIMYFKPMENLNDSNRTPAISYPRIADSILSGIIAGLMERGYTENMASAFITSKILRCELDGKLEDALFNFAKFYGETIAPTYIDKCEQYAKED